MSDQGDRIESVLTFLEQGRITIEDAVTQIGKMSFTASAKPDSVWDTIMADGAGDMEPPEPDSFFPVSHAYAAGRITHEQYTELAKAAAAVVADGEA